jgi:hypothetical protein
MRRRKIMVNGLDGGTYTFTRGSTIFITSIINDDYRSDEMLFFGKGGVILNVKTSPTEDGRYEHTLRVSGSTTELVNKAIKENAYLLATTSDLDQKKVEESFLSRLYHRIHKK